MPNDEVIDPEKAGEGAEKGEISKAASDILEEVRKLSEEKKDPVSAPSSQPKIDPNVWVAQRDDFKKKMNFNEEQMQLYERDKASAQAPMLLEVAKMKVREAHKDYDQLKTAFETEVATYVARGQIVNTELADKIFLMVKGQELEAGRYTPPSSQPAKSGAPAPAASGGRASRIASPGYSGSEPSLSGGSAGGGKGEEGEANISDREKQYAGILNVDPKDYKQMKEEKEKGIREIADRSYRAPEIDVKTAGPADRDLAALWGKNGGRI